MWKTNKNYQSVKLTDLKRATRELERIILNIKEPFKEYKIIMIDIFKPILYK